MRLLLALVLAVAACRDPELPPPPPEAPPALVEDGLPLVNVFMGSGGFGFNHGAAFPGACAPRGMVKVGPDTSGPNGTVRFLHFSGYWYGDDTVQGFSHLHLAGTGASDYGVLSVMPIPAFDPARLRVEQNASKFAKASEKASPGFYGLGLDNGGVTVELTARRHSAHHRYTFASGTPTLLLDLAKHLDGGRIELADLTLVPAERRFSGKLHSVGGMSGGFGGYDVFFAARTREPWTSAQVFSDGTPPSTATNALGTGVGAALVFAPGKPVELQLAVSFVSVENAQKNLDAELPAFDFEGEEAATEAEWRALVNAARVGGGSEADQRTFYSSVHHLFLMPAVQSDVDGRYHAHDGSIRTADGFAYESELSLWDTYRTAHPLYDLLYPEQARDAVRSLQAMADARGSFPRWPLATGEAGSMVGASADIVVADAVLKGVPGLDANALYAKLRAAALDPTPPSGGRGGRSGYEDYVTQGWVTAAQERSASITTEFAHDDFALAELAKALGKADDEAALRGRSKGYRNLFDPATGFLRERTKEGAFPAGPFDPVLFSRDYVEADAWQSLWMPGLHDLDGLAQLLGGREAFVSKLEEFFEKAKAEYESLAKDDLVRDLPRPYYWHSNEPDIHAAYLFALAGRPDLTQKWARWVLRTFHRAAPDGLAGNDDGGTLSGWFVFTALGLYPIAGSDQYILGAPLFPVAELQLPGGVFRIEAKHVTEENLYVQAVTLDGEPVSTPTLAHGQLRAGSTLVFEMGPEPKR